MGDGYTGCLEGDRLLVTGERRLCLVLISGVPGPLSRWTGLLDKYIKKKMIFMPGDFERSKQPGEKLPGEVAEWSKAPVC